MATDRSGSVTTVIETQGSTSLSQAGGHYFLYDSVGSGPSLKIWRHGFCGRSIWHPGRRSARSRRRRGYEVAWKDAWHRSVHGLEHRQQRQLRLTILAAPGCRAAALRCNRSRPASIRISNGDGQIGLVTTVIETQGATDLTQVADHYFLYDSVGSGPSLKIWRRGFCGRSIWRLGADRCGADGDRL